MTNRGAAGIIGEVRAVLLGAGLAASVCLAAAAQPIPVPAPRQPSRIVDPIGALIAEQGVDAARAALPIVIGLKLAESAGKARLSLELSDSLNVRVFTLVNPNRVVIDMPEVLWRVPGEARPSGKGLMKSYRYGLFRKGNSRFVIDLGVPVKVESSEILPPSGGSGFRFEIGLARTTPDDFQAHAGWPAGLSAFASAEPTPLPPASSGQGAKRLIVIDPGHGGLDPGTHGQSGLQEKDLVLSVARGLRKTLEATRRYRVQLTRDSDVFIPLRERVGLARAAHGDLFVSLHADSNDHRELRGASVYTLSEAASDHEAATLAERENMSDVIAGVDLSGENSPVASILIDLAQRDTLNRSARFAETLISSLQGATSVLPQLPHRAAGFAVLKAPDVPAVLIELGYLTNLKDENEMATEAWRNRVAAAISAAINAHFAGPASRQADNR